MPPRPRRLRPGRSAHRRARLRPRAALVEHVVRRGEADDPWPGLSQPSSTALLTPTGGDAEHALGTWTASRPPHLSESPRIACATARPRARQMSLRCPSRSLPGQLSVLPRPWSLVLLGRLFAVSHRWPPAGFLALVSCAADGCARRVRWPADATGPTATLACCTGGAAGRSGSPGMGTVTVSSKPALSSPPMLRNMLRLAPDIGADQHLVGQFGQRRGQRLARQRRHGAEAAQDGRQDLVLDEDRRRPRA